jgi:cysteinyl-tRNA synthetase
MAAMLLFVTACAWSLAVIPWPQPTLDVRTGPPITSVAQWGYQLQRFDPRLLPPDADMVVVDYSRDGTERRALGRSQVEALRRRDGRPPRIVLAYLSVGEAESYRYYWRNHWKVVRPAWIGTENPNWQDNFSVHYWHPEWRVVLITSPSSALSRLYEVLSGKQSSYVDRILDAGFDGLFLDRVDAFYHWREKRPTAEAEMVDLVTEISRHAKSRRPGALVVVQNGEELLGHEDYRRAIDGIAKEDLFYGVDGPERRNSDDQIAASLENLAKAKSAGRPVFVVEYLRDPENRRDAAARARAAGFPVLFADRDLNRAPEPGTTR